MSELYRAMALENNKELEQLILARAAKNFYIRGEQERFDLFPFYSILVSAGTNINTDHFDPIELWKARHSPIDKPVNIGHNQKRIIGHTMDCIAVDENIKPIPEDIDEGDLPYKLHIITSSVIYRIWEDPIIQAEVDAIINEVSNGSIFVSMECLFRDFAYLLTNASNNEKKVLPRNSQTIGLTKYLRQYKGPGKIHNYSLARLLKNITFSAVGIVRKPANPESTISNSFDLFSTNANSLVYIKLDDKKMENKMPEEIIKAEETSNDFKVEDHPTYKNLNDSHTALKHAHDSLKDDHERMKKDHDHLHNRLKELNDKLDEVHKKTMAESEKMPEGKDCPKTEVEKERDSADFDKNMPNPPNTGKKTLKGPDKSSYAKENSMAETSDNEDTMKEMAELKSTVASLQEKNISLAKANDAMKATLDEFKKASRHSNRAEAMMTVDVSLTREAALQAVAKFDELSDAGFNGMLEMMKGYAEKAPKEVTAATVVENAKAEKDVQYGANPENEIAKTTADIKAWLSPKKDKK